MVLKLSNLNSNLALTLGYLNPASNNLAKEWFMKDLMVPMGTELNNVINN